MKKLSKQGNYGTVYEGKYKKKKAIYKTNSLPDVNLQHERDVMLVLNSDQRMKSFFPRLLDYKETAKSQCIVMEFIEHEFTLYDAMDELNTSEKELIYLHLYCMLKVAREICDFTHYDLHFDNILMVKASQSKHVYTFNDGTRTILPYDDYRPIMIDFGFSYCRGVTGLRAPMTQTHHYMNPMVFCPIHDIYILQKNFQHWGVEFEVGLRHARRHRQFKRSLFDLLARVTQCADYPRDEGETPPTTEGGASGYNSDCSSSGSSSCSDNERQWRDVGRWKSVRTLRENQLFTHLFHLDDSIVPIEACHATLESKDLQGVLMYWIKTYQEWYKETATFTEAYTSRYLESTLKWLREFA